MTALLPAFFFPATLALTNYPAKIKKRGAQYVIRKESSQILSERK